MSHTVSCDISEEGCRSTLSVLHTDLRAGMKDSSWCSTMELAWYGTCAKTGAALGRVRVRVRVRVRARVWVRARVRVRV